MEKELHDRVFTLLGAIGRFLTTYRSFIVHPKNAFSRLFSSQNNQLTKPGAFLVANIGFSYLLGKSIGYDLPPFPLDIPALQNLAGSYSFVIFRFLLGIFVFLVILRWIIRYKSAESFLLIVFPILCYASVVYLPFVLVKRYYFDVLSQDFWEIFSNFFHGVAPKFLAWTLAKYLLVPPLVFLTLIAWWLWLVHAGLTNSKLKSSKPRRKIILAYVLFFSLQLFSVLLATTITNWSILSACKTLAFQDIQAELTKSPPNYFKAASLAANISDNENMPDFIRYVFKLRKAAYLLATPLFEGESPFTKQVLKDLEVKEFASAKSLLSDHLHRLSSDAKNPGRQSYLQLANEVKEAEDLFNSPRFVDLGKTAQLGVGFMFGLSKSSYSIDLNDKKIQINLAIQPSWIALFP